MPTYIYSCSGFVEQNMEFDSALKHVGEFGRYQRRVYFVVSILSLPLSFHMLIFVFVSAVGEWSCPSTSTHGNILHCNSTERRCCDSDGSICHGAVFSSNYSSIATEWGLVCGNRYKAELTQSIFVAGYMFGVLVFGVVSDKFGRRKPWLFTFVIGNTLAAMSGMVSSYEEYVMLRFFIGALNGGGGLITYILATESIGPSYRGSAGIWQQGFYSVGYAILALEAYFIRDWRVLTIFTVLPSFAILILLRSIPESPRWLASQGRTEEAESIVRKIEKENGLQSNLVIFLKKDSHKHASRDHYGIIDLFTRRSISGITAVMLIVWCVNSMVYYGLALNVRNLGGSLYINFVLASVTELPSCAFTQFLISKLGRKKSLLLLLLAAGLFCFMCMLLQLNGGKHITAISTTSLAGRFCISSSFGLIYVYSAELFPTVVRNIGMGMSSLSARIGGMIAPFVVLLGDQVVSLPMLCFTCTAVFAAIVSLQLPETQGRPLPETFEDIEKDHFENSRSEIEPAEF